MNLQFQKAVRKQTKLRLGLVGPSGSGKTYTALRLAMSLSNKRIAVIDTENGSAAKYAGEDLPEGATDFDVLELQEFEPKTYIAAINAAVKSGAYDVLIIDGITPAWTAVKDIADNAARRYKGNSFAGWREATPEHNSLVDALVKCPVHLIVTMRAKTEWILDKDERSGKTSPRKIGLAPEQRAGMEYEFDVVGTMDWDNVLVIDKSRCSALTGKTYKLPGKDVANVLKAWLDSGDADAPAPPAGAPPPQQQEQPRQPQQQPETPPAWWADGDMANDIAWVLACWKAPNGTSTRERAIALVNAGPEHLKEEMKGALRAIAGRAHCPHELLRDVFAAAWERGLELGTLGVALGRKYGLPLKVAADLDAEYAARFLNGNKPQPQPEPSPPPPPPAPAPVDQKNGKLPPPGDGGHDPLSTVEDWVAPVGSKGLTLVKLAHMVTAASDQAAARDLVNDAADGLDGTDPVARLIRVVHVSAGLDPISACPAGIGDISATFEAAWKRGLDPSMLIASVDLLRATPAQLSAWREAA